MVSKQNKCSFRHFFCVFLEVPMSEKMLREIANDSLTPKKSDKESSSDLFERLRGEDEDGLDYEIESYEVISEYR